MIATTGCNGNSAHRAHRGHWTMKFPWHSRSEGGTGGAGSAAGASYESEREVASQSHPAVRLRIARMTFAHRIALMREVRELARRVEFLSAGKEPADNMDAALLQADIDRVYVRCGVRKVLGLRIDGAVATPEDLVSGPEEL